MNQSIKIGQIAGLNLFIRPLAIVSALLLGGILGLVGVRLCKFTPRKAIWGGLTAVSLHYLANLWHHLGHARAAEITGYPMAGIDFWGPLGTSLYPDDEPTLSAEVHIQRALGGPIASATLSLFAGLLWLSLRPLGDIYALIATLFFLDNSLIFTLGAFLPLGFTDGSTILRWWPQRNRQQLTLSS